MVDLVNRTQGQARRQRSQDVAEWCRAAHVLDQRAEALLGAISESVAVLDAHDAHPHVVHESTRGPRQQVLREISRSLARRHPEPARLHRAADALYWRMVMAFDVSQRTESRTWAAAWGVDADDLCQTMRLGWYQAAIRFDPDRGYSLLTFAKRHALVAVQRAGIGHTGGIHVRTVTASGRDAPKITMLAFDAPLGREGISADMTLGDVLASDGQMIVARPHPAGFSVPGEVGYNEDSDRARITAMVETLPAREREVLTLRYLDLSEVDAEDLTTGCRNLASVGRAMGGFSRERARQLEVRAVSLLRDAYCGPTGLAKVPVRRPSAMTA